MARARPVKGPELAKHASLQITSVVIGVVIGGALTMIIKQGLKRSGHHDMAKDWG